MPAPLSPRHLKERRYYAADAARHAMLLMPCFADTLRHAMLRHDIRRHCCHCRHAAIRFHCISLPLLMLLAFRLPLMLMD